MAPDPSREPPARARRRPWQQMTAWITGALTARAEPSFRLDQLSPRAQEQAVRTVRDKLGGLWWREEDEDDVRDAMTIAFAERLGTPDHLADSGEVHGIPGVRVSGQGFDSSASIWVNGSLTRDTAPALPWCEGITSITLSATEPDETIIHLVHADATCTCGAGTAQPRHDVNCLALLPTTVDPEQRFRLVEAVRTALALAWEAGKDERANKTGMERARYVAEDHLFTTDGAAVSDLPY